MSRLLGVSDNYGLVFEGHSSYGANLVWPSPNLTPAIFLDSSAKAFSTFDVGNPPRYYFREDTFDPVSRVRRGRFYKYPGSTGATWWVLPSSQVTIPRSSVNDEGLMHISVVDYSSCAISAELKTLGIPYPVVVLGKGSSSTIWAIINIETGFTGEEMVTLKARQSLGALPELDMEKLHVLKGGNVQEALQTLEDDYHLASPESVVDRANEAPTRILNTFLETKGRSSQDSLYKAITEAGKLEQQDKKEIVRNSAEIVRLLHGRTKYAVQRDKNTRDVREQDAELAMQCIGIMLCDLGWAAWR
ncbi:MAG: hypothetical protein WC236_08940 [Gallionellaceae bacterium]|jgi:hypothetical protein